MQTNAGSRLFVKIYHGYGHAQNLIVFGHVLKNKPAHTSEQYTHNIMPNIVRLIRLFIVKPVAGARLRLRWGNQLQYTTSQEDGFFKFEWQAPEGVKAGWNRITIDCIDEQDNILGTGEGHLFVPHIAQYAFISDIDDTVLVSHSATIFKRLRLLFIKNPHTRTAFPDVVQHYRLLATAQASDEVPNPFYYVSSSEWNLYNDLIVFFDYNQLPKGVFLLNQIKKWYQLLKTGKTKHEGKLLRVVRILEAFPNQQFVLLGDNSQRDPSIYATVVEKYAAQIFAVYIRKVHLQKEMATRNILAEVEKKGVHTCFYTNSTEAIEHSYQIGLITRDELEPKR